MDRSVLRLPDPVTGAARPERRRSVRQKLHTPVYASFSGSQSGMVVDLSELLDLHEDGFAVQTSERLDVNRAVTLCLDLTETRSYIHCGGHVIWSDDSGRGGIRFAALSDSSRRILKEWLFANLLIACSNHAARAEQLARREQEKLAELVPVDESSVVVSIADGTGTLASVEAVRVVVRQMNGDVDAILRFILERALSLTESTGAALAILTDDKMICRLRTGEPAPPLDATLDAAQGLSGECVRSGRLVSCEDTNKDPRVDPDVCRILGVGALMAAPIVSDFRVVGVLEVLSPHPRSFTKTHATVLDQLVEMIPGIFGNHTQPETAPSRTSAKSDDVLAAPHASAAQSDSTTPDPVPEQDSEPASTPPARLLYRALIGLAIAAIVTALGYVAGPVVKNWAQSPQGAQWLVVKVAQAGSKVVGPSAADPRSVSAGPADSSSTASVASDRGSQPKPKSLPEVQELANAGDADAQWQVGVRYHDGEGLPRDDAQAVQWFQRAADQGNVAAQGALGAYYWRGRGVPADLSKAYFWSVIAMAQGDEMSKSRIEGLSSQMTATQVTNARQQADVWIGTHNLRAKGEVSH